MSKYPADMDQLGLRALNIVDSQISYWDKDMVCRYANFAFQKWFGKTEDELLGKITIKDLLGASYKKNEPFIKAALTGQAQRFEKFYTTEIDKKLHAVVTYEPDIVDGKVVGFIYQAVDFTKFSGIQTKINSAEFKLLQIIDYLPDAIFVSDTEGKIKIVNQAAAKLFGYSADELIGEDIQKVLLIAATSQTKAKIKSKNLIANVENTSEALYGVNKNGQRVEIEVTRSSIALGDHLLVSYAIRDISEAKRIDKAKKEIARLNSIFVEQSAFANAMVDANMCYVAVSKRWYSDFGIKLPSVIGRSHYEVFPEIGQAWKDLHLRCLKGETISCDMDKFERADGSIQWLRWDARPWYQTDGSIGGILMFSEDLTDMKIREVQHENIQYIINKSTSIAKIAVWEINFLNDSVTYSDGAYQILDLEKDYEFNADTLFDLCKDDQQRAKLRVAADGISSSNRTYDIELEILSGKGQMKWLRVIGEADFVNGINTRRYGVFQDITKSKETEMHLSRLNEDLSAVLNSGQVSIISTDLKGHVRYLNYGAEKMLGFSNSGVLLQKDIMLLHESKELAERKSEFQSKFDCVLDDFGAVTIHAIKGNFEARPWTYKSGAGQLIPVQLTVTPIRNNKGVITGYLFVAVDVSNVKEVKGKLRSLLEITLQQNKRLKNFAHIVSHNLRSHSANIEMLVDLLLQEQPQLQNDQGTLYLQKASKNLKETIIHLNEVVAINAEENSSLVPVKLRSSIEQNLQSLIQEIQEAKITVVNKVPPDIKVHALPAYIDSITLNLLTNAIKYRNHQVDSFVKFDTAVKDGFVVLTVEDNGLGINLNLHGRKIFKMYKTFHGNKDSRGIGLFITKNQIEAMGGTIDVISEVKVGTTFTVKLRHEEY